MDLTRDSYFIAGLYAVSLADRTDEFLAQLRPIRRT
jgi:hypothetical protein